MSKSPRRNHLAALHPGHRLATAVAQSRSLRVRRSGRFGQTPDVVYFAAPALSRTRPPRFRGLSLGCESDMNHTALKQCANARARAVE